MHGPPNPIVGPAPCQGCGQLVWWAKSWTRLGGEVIAGFPRWREQGGRVHRCSEQ